jgi:uncharacterized membrane protein YgdD (TMEM256/DUF423 family)
LSLAPARTPDHPREVSKTWLIVSALLGFLGVAAGAFGAHGLRGRLEPRDLEIFETAVRYQLVHALALGLVAALAGSRASGALNGAGWAFTIGVGVFSGSLYALVLTQTRWLGAITPLGGVAMLVGWILLGVHALRS